MSGMDVEHTVRDLWATRPRRRADDRRLGGVAAAIGRRYAVDPVLVRVAFVVATFFSGAGVLLYLLGWLLLPAEGDETSAAESLFGRGRSSAAPGLTLVLGLAVIPAAFVVLGGDLYGLLGLAAAGTAMFLLHRSRATLGELPAAAGSTRGSGTAGTAAPGAGEQGAEPGPGETRPTPPAWDPLGAAPFAWDLSDPAPVTPPTSEPPRRPRSKVTPITLAFALLVGGLTAAFWPALPLGHLAALVLAVVGFGLVAGSLVRGGRGLVAIAVPLALLTWVLHAVPVTGFKVGEDRWVPATAAEVQPRYDLTLGSGSLDLTGLRLSEGQAVTTAVAVGVGEVRVMLPQDVDAQVSCQAPIGAVECLGVPSSGIPARVNTQDDGADGTGGGTLVLDVRAGVGHVQVER